MRTLTPAAFLGLFLLCSPIDSPRACTSFCLETPDGPFYATNLDLMTGDGHLFVNRRGIAKEGYGESTTGVTATWVSRYGSITFNLAGVELPWGGMNEAGLAMSTMQLNASRCPAPDERPPFGEGNLLQYVLDTCATVPEAIEVIKRVRLAQHECSSHYLVADENGECAAIEYLDGHFVYRTGDRLPIKALANARYSSGVAYVDLGVVPADNPGASVERVAAAAARMEAYRLERDGSPVDYSLAVLTETVVAPRKFWSDWFGEAYTRWSIVFDLTNREAHFRTVAHRTVRHLSLHDFDLSCDAPQLMLDVNARLEGNVGAAFEPYDHDTNLDVFRTFCDKWGIEVSETDAIGLIRLFEGFDCSAEPGSIN